MKTKDVENKIRGMIDEAINEIFGNLQKEYGIEYGDISPDLYFDIDFHEGKITEKILEYLKMEGENNEDK